MEEEGDPNQPLLGGDAISSDDTRLNQLGYKQELSRHLSQLLDDFLHHIGSDWSQHNVQCGPQIWWARYHGLRVARSGLSHTSGGPVHGRDLLCFSNFWWALLLERQTRWQTVGPLRFLANWLYEPKDLAPIAENLPKIIILSLGKSHVGSIIFSARQGALPTGTG
ncbi:amino-acid permease BAT1-like protein [Pyrus ussuriensis x Pyrus communis]|uniref:Amino-acid permease BAT1-like protein n=1 Tax=Pyrus ussuriensis x Pyrus communis TaxID=2448454 RepID=A0A5N5FLM4_9ROSA|nr:amino-acid permease BAT1-like protein [Pyrus ussuriensis x Pyrus communis]KAB2624229.1 amino-acid permease BAT1-like protein [Pyrus ussuriensis x Pyrus communis]